MELWKPLSVRAMGLAGRWVMIIPLKLLVSEKIVEPFIIEEGLWQLVPWYLFLFCFILHPRFWNYLIKINKFLKLRKIMF